MELESHAEPVENVQCMVTTANFIVRRYSFEFTRKGKHASQFMAPHEMFPLLEADRATLYIRNGAFGWTSMENYHWTPPLIRKSRAGRRRILLWQVRPTC